jgi:hypothetical protein
MKVIREKCERYSSVNQRVGRDLVVELGGQIGEARDLEEKIIQLHKNSLAL